jgi:UDP-2,4-diacetamido-2,4,6-trideoxy-beta-L-altropyranose hydrolase
MNQRRAEAEQMTLVIRADAGPVIGAGHLMRCLALAVAWKNAGGRAVFMLGSKADPLEARLSSEGMEIVHTSARPGSVDDAAETAELAGRTNAPWIVVDGYQFSADYQRLLKEAGSRLLLIDDRADSEHYFADLVLNQNIYAHERLYRGKEPYTRLLLGPRYVLLRSEFSNWREWRREIPGNVRNILVTLGGGDSDNLTLKVINAISMPGMENREVRVVVGPSNPHLGSLQEAADLSPLNLRLLTSVEDMAEQMAWADLAISAAGSTCWELAFMGLPGLLLPLAENQRPIAERLDAEGIARNLGWYENVQPNRIRSALEDVLSDQRTRTEMSSLGQALIDGLGGERVVKELSLG